MPDYPYEMLDLREDMDDVIRSFENDPETGEPIPVPILGGCAGCGGRIRVTEPYSTSPDGESHYHPEHTPES